MAVRKRALRWPIWTRPEKPSAQQTPLAEPFRSTLRRIDEQFIGINRVIIDAYVQSPDSKHSGRANRISMLEQDEPYNDHSETGDDPFEDEALLGRLADLLCPEVWTAFFTDLTQGQWNDGCSDTSMYKETVLPLIQRRWEKAAELYDGTYKDLLTKKLAKVQFGIETKINLLSILLVINSTPDRLHLAGRVPGLVSQGSWPSGSYVWQRTAYEEHLTVQRLTRDDIATLIAVSSVVVVLSAFLMLPAWTAITSSTSVGSARDADFWNLLQASCMQLLGVFTAIYPIRRLPLVASSARTWAQLFAALGLITTVSAIPIYTYASIFWSSVLSFLGSAAQAFLVLQLAMLTIAAPRAALVKAE